MKLPLLSLLVALSLYASSSACPKFYLDGISPEFTNDKLSQNTQELCYEAFGVMHSGITKTPLWSAEILLRENLENKPPRKDVFHEESKLPRNERSELSDFIHSGYDRGHLSPSADMPTQSAQAESFTLANIIPQVHTSNAGVWSSIESATRYFAKKEGAIYVITGPLYLGKSVKSIGNGVLVPTMIYKIIYSIKQQKGAVYIVQNAASEAYQIISIQELEKISGISYFPKLNNFQKSQMLQLPEPKKISKR